MTSVSVARRAAVPLERGRVAPGAALATVASLGIFITAQTLLLLRAHHLMWEAFLLQNGPHYANEVVGSIWPDLLFTTGRFCGLMLVGIALAAAGRRRAYAVPAVAWFLLSMTHGPALVHLPHPVPIGVGWGPVSGTAIAVTVRVDEPVGRIGDRLHPGAAPRGRAGERPPPAGMLRPAGWSWPPVTLGGDVHPLRVRPGPDDARVASRSTRSTRGRRCPPWCRCSCSARCSGHAAPSLAVDGRRGPAAGPGGLVLADPARIAAPAANAAVGPAVRGRRRTRHRARSGRPRPRAAARVARCPR